MSENQTNGWARLLSDNMGRTIVAEFIVGEEALVVKTGALSAVTTEYLVLDDAARQTSVVCAMDALRFVTFCPAAASAQPQAAQPETTVPEAAPVPAPAAEAPAPDAAQPKTNDAPLAVRDVTPVATAALNYAKRKARRLD